MINRIIISTLLVLLLFTWIDLIGYKKLNKGLITIIKKQHEVINTLNETAFAQLKQGEKI